MTSLTRLFLIAGCLLPVACRAEPAEDPPNSLNSAEQAPANRLARETSPYLRQHAHNPVDWYPWGEEALDRAQRENKLIFLSIGYSSCHWCHVMERESFTDLQIAEFLNKHFVCIKVDREERPDVDSIYMTAVQIINRGSGGWPLSVFLTPAGKPFFGGSYFPARDNDRPGSTGFLTIIQRISSLWNDKPNVLRSDAQRLTEAIVRTLSNRPNDTPIDLGPALAQRAVDILAAGFDPTYGGFGYHEINSRIPKFPQASQLVLLQQAANQGDSKAKQMLITTLERMAMGGIWDHVGGGFHRYSVDRFWHIPHFEKMLYDNGQLATAYAQAYQMTAREDFRHTVEELVSFLTREMTAPGGGFYTALDADSEHEEGKFYRWTPDEWADVLGREGADEFSTVFAADGKPNFEGQDYVPIIHQPWLQLAQQQGTTFQELETRLAPYRQKLLAARSQRIRPGTDTKILTGWNGLMIRGLADAGQALERPDYTEAAAKAARFLLENLQTDEGRLQRTYSEGEARLNGYLDDYAFLVSGLIGLYRNTGQKEWLEAAQKLTDKQIELFWDDQAGGFFFTSTDHESLIARGKRFMDSAQPAGNSVSAENLMVLSAELGSDDYRDYAIKTIQAASSLLGRNPSAAPRLVAVAAELD